MNPDPMSESKGATPSHVFETCDPDFLRQLREAAGMDELVLARTACMSIAQVRELERGTQTGVFYTVGIRRQAYKRLLMILGAEPPGPAPIDLPEPTTHDHDAQLQNLDQIVAMSEQPAISSSPWLPVQEALQRMAAYKQAWAAGSLLLIATVLLVMHWPAGGLSAVVRVAPEAPASVPAASSTPVTVVPPAPAPVPEPVRVASAPVTIPAPAPVASVPVTTASVGACAFTTEALPQVSPMVASKPANYVYLVSAGAADVCVVDGNKQVTRVVLKAGESRSVYGAPPWQMSSANLRQLQIYFQGWRVSLPSDDTQRMSLVEKVSTP